MESCWLCLYSLEITVETVELGDRFLLQLQLCTLNGGDEEQRPSTACKALSSPFNLSCPWGVCLCVCDRTITGHTPSRCLHLFLLVFCVFEVVGTLAFFGLFLLCFILATKRANFSAHLRAMKELRICLKTIGVPSAKASATSGCPVCTARSVESM